MSSRMDAIDRSFAELFYVSSEDDDRLERIFGALSEGSKERLLAILIAGLSDSEEPLDNAPPVPVMPILDAEQALDLIDSRKRIKVLRALRRRQPKTFQYEYELRILEALLRRQRPASGVGQEEVLQDYLLPDEEQFLGNRLSKGDADGESEA